MAVLTALLTPLAAFGAVWVSAPDIDRLQFQAHMASLSKRHKTYAQSQLEALRQRAKAFGIKEKIEKAQAAYLAGRPSGHLFKAIADLAYHADWSDEERRAILYSFLRAAQLEKEPERQKALLMSASHFLLRPLEADHPEYSLFAPPLLERLNKMKKEAPSFAIRWQKIFPQYDIILINGQRMEAQSALKEAKYRLTALSSSHAPYIRTAPLSALLSARSTAARSTAARSAAAETLTEGPCGALSLKPHYPSKSVKIFNRKKCPPSYRFAAPGAGHSGAGFPAGARQGKAAKTAAEGGKTGQMKRMALSAAVGGASAAGAGVPAGAGAPAGVPANAGVPAGAGLSGRADQLEGLLAPFGGGELYPDLNAKKKEGIFSKKHLPKWIAIGGAVLIAGGAIALMSQESKAPAPPKQGQTIFY